jgi:uncharacterized membrane protein
VETLPAVVAQLPLLFTALDLGALAVFFGLSLVTTLMVERPPRRHPSVSILMEAYRRSWMEVFSHRDNRVFDASLLNSLRGGASFFASTCLIAIGGTAALLGQTEQILSVVRDLGAQAADGAQPVWEAKLLVILVLLVNAFLKFVWSHRLFGYCAVLMGAMPEGASADALARHVDRASRLQCSAARSFNRGLRSVYFVIAALAWFLGPVPLMVAAVLTAAMLFRREFLSASRRALDPSQAG